MIKINANKIPINSLDEKRSKIFYILFKPDILPLVLCAREEFPVLFANIMLGYHFSKSKFQRDRERDAYTAKREDLWSRKLATTDFSTVPSLHKHARARIVALLPLCSLVSSRDSQPTPFSRKNQQRRKHKGKKDIEKVKLTGALTRISLAPARLVKRGNLSFDKLIS